MAVGVVGRDAHPAGRALDGGTSVDGLRDQIQQSRTSIAQDILACTLPTVTGVASL
jgi:hypothetical protein